MTVEGREGGDSFRFLSLIIPSWIIPQPTPRVQFESVVDAWTISGSFYPLCIKSGRSLQHDAPPPFTRLFVRRRNNGREKKKREWEGADKKEEVSEMQLEKWGDSEGSQQMQRFKFMNKVIN